MIQNFYLVLFLLFFAVLAAGYFYLQRAKARDTGAEAPATAPAASAATDAPAADEGTDNPAT